MKVSQKLMRELLTSAASGVVSLKEAEYFADESIETHLRKIPRNNPIKSTINDVIASVKNKNTPISIENDLWASLRINFMSHWPLVYSKMIHDLVEERSKKYGICMVSLVNGQWIHTLQHWVQWLAKRWIISLISANGWPAGVIPYNGTKWIFWTNPLAYWIPNTKGIQCIDMASSEAPYFEIMWAHARWVDLREWVAVNSLWEPTVKTSEALDFSKPEAISNLIPMWGGYKWYNIVYFLELLTSGLIGSPSSPEMSDDFIPEEHGAILIAFNSKALGTEKNLQISLDSINNELQSQKPKEWETIEIPWIRSNVTLEKNRDLEIEIDDALFEKLKNI